MQRLAKAAVVSFANSIKSPRTPGSSGLGWMTNLIRMTGPSPHNFPSVRIRSEPHQSEQSASKQASRMNLCKVNHRLIRRIWRLCGLGLIANLSLASTGCTSTRVPASGVMFRPTSPTCSVELMSTDQSALQARLRSDGTIQIGDVINQRDQALKTFLQLRGTRSSDQALWIEIDDTLKVEQVLPFLSKLGSIVPTWKLLLITGETHSVCDSAFWARRRGAA